MHGFDLITLYEGTLQETRVSISNAHHFLLCKCVQRLLESCYVVLHIIFEKALPCSFGIFSFDR